MNLQQPLPIARYGFVFRVTSEWRLPEFAGSTLRGAFGHALRQLSCITGERTCDQCPAAVSCPYAWIFEPERIERPTTSFATIQTIPVPYIIEPPRQPMRHLAEGDEYHFSMVLIGPALDHLPMIIMAWRRAMLRGIGATKGKAELLRVEWHDPAGQRISVYDEHAPQVKLHQPRINVPGFSTARGLRLCFDTPVRLMQQGNVLGARQLSGSLMVRSLIRRLSMLDLYHLNPGSESDLPQIKALLEQANQTTAEIRMRWKDNTRFSSRQQQKTPLGGVIGWVLLHQVSPQLQKILYLGQWLHIGKETAFGLGAYRIVDENNSQVQENIA